MIKDLDSFRLGYALLNEVSDDTFNEFIESQELKNCACGGNCYNSVDNRSVFDMLNEGEDISNSYRFD